MDEARAWNYCLWLLGRRSYSRAELQERMGRKGAEPGTVASVIRRLEEYGFVDDAQFAEQFVDSRAGRYGSLRLRAELLRKGIDEELVERKLTVLDEGSQEDAAVALLKRHAWRFTKGEDSRRTRARAWAFLARRGFPPGLVTAAVERFEAQQPTGTGEADPE